MLVRPKSYPSMKSKEFSSCFIRYGNVVTMVQKALLEEEKIERTIRAVTNDSFTVLDFMAAFQEKYPVDWDKLVRGLGNLGVREGIQSQPISR